MKLQEEAKESTARATISSKSEHLDDQSIGKFIFYILKQIDSENFSVRQSFYSSAFLGIALTRRRLVVSQEESQATRTLQL